MVNIMLNFGHMVTSLAGNVALGAGATRGAGRGIAVQLGAAGATVHVTGRMTNEPAVGGEPPGDHRGDRSSRGRGGRPRDPVRVDHFVPSEVSARDAHPTRPGPPARPRERHLGAGIEWAKSAWESSLETGLHTLLLAVDTHAITSHYALPLLIEQPGGPVVEVTDGTDEYNASHYRVSFFYDLAKALVNRMAFALAHELRPHGATAVSLTPGWLRSEAMLDAHGVTEANWRDAIAHTSHFAISESPAFVGRAVAALAQDPGVARWNGQSLSSGQLARVYGFTDLDGSRPDAWRYVPEVQDAGRPT